MSSSTAGKKPFISGKKSAQSGPFLLTRPRPRIIYLLSRVKFEFDNVALVQFESGSAMQSLSIDGDLTMRQTWPLGVYGGYRRLYTDDLYPTIAWGVSKDDVDVHTVMQRQGARNGNRLNTRTLFTFFHSLPLPSFENRHFFPL